MGHRRMTRRFIVTRDGAEHVANLWYNHTPIYAHDLFDDVWTWLDSDSIKGRWCMPPPPYAGYGGLYFEYLEDLVLFTLTWQTT